MINQLSMFFSRIPFDNRALQEKLAGFAKL